MNSRRYLIFVISGLIVAVFAGGISFLNLADAKPVPITTKVTRGHIEETVLASGTLYAIKSVEIGAQVSGQLEHLHVSLGEQVAKGELLAEIDPVLQQNSLKEAEAERENIQAEILAKQALLKQYRLNYERLQQLLPVDGTNRADFESAEGQYQSTLAGCQALQAQLKKAVIAVATAKANLAYTRITAPMAGTVVSIEAEEGQTLVSSQAVSTILTLANLNQMTIKAQISEADVMKVKPGQNVEFTTLGDPEKRYRGTLRAIEPSPVDDSSSSSSAVYYNGLFDIANADHLLRVGMTAEVTIILDQVEQALLAPVGVLRDNGHHFETMVDVFNGERPEPRRVVIGLNDTVNVQIVSGVKEGEALLVHAESLPANNSTDDNSDSMRPPGGPLGPPPGRP